MHADPRSRFEVWELASIDGSVLVRTTSTSAWLATSARALETLRMRSAEMAKVFMGMSPFGER